MDLPNDGQYSDDSYEVSPTSAGDLERELNALKERRSRARGRGRLPYPLNSDPVQEEESNNTPLMNNDDNENKNEKRKGKGTETRQVQSEHQNRRTAESSSISEAEDESEERDEDEEEDEDVDRYAGRATTASTKSRRTRKRRVKRKKKKTPRPNSESAVARSQQQQQNDQNDVGAGGASGRATTSGGPGGQRPIATSDDPRSRKNLRSAASLADRTNTGMTSSSFMSRSSEQLLQDMDESKERNGDDERPKNSANQIEVDEECEEEHESATTDTQEADTSIPPKVSAVCKWINYEEPHYLQPYDMSIYYVLDEYCGGSGEPSHVVDVAEPLWFGEENNNEDRMDESDDEDKLDAPSPSSVGNRAESRGSADTGARGRTESKRAQSLPSHVWHQTADRVGLGVASNSGNQAPLLLLGDSCSGYSSTLLHWAQLRILNHQGGREGEGSMAELERLHNCFSSGDSGDDTMALSVDSGFRVDGIFQSSSPRHESSGSPKKNAQRGKSSSDQHECLIIHRCGASREASKVRTLLIRVIREISNFFRLNTEISSTMTEDRLALQFARVLDTVGRIAQTGGGAAAQATADADEGAEEEGQGTSTKSTRLIIVIDNVHLLRSSVFESFQWMPLVTPKNVHIIMSGMAPSSLVESYLTKADKLVESFASENDQTFVPSHSSSVISQYASPNKGNESNNKSGSDDLSVELPMYSLKWQQWMQTGGSNYLRGAILVSRCSTAQAEHSMTFERMQEQERTAEGQRSSERQSARALSTVPDRATETEFTLDTLDSEDVWRQVMFESEKNVVVKDALRRKCPAIIVPSTSHNQRYMDTQKLFSNSSFFEDVASEDIEYYLCAWKRVYSYLLEVITQREASLSQLGSSIDVPTDIVDAIAGIWISQCFASVPSLEMLCEAAITRVVEDVDISDLASVSLPWDNVRPMLSRLSQHIYRLYESYVKRREYTNPVDRNHLTTEVHITLATEACAETILQEWIEHTQVTLSRKAEHDSSVSYLLNACNVEKAFDLLMWLILVTREGVTWKEYVSFLAKENFGKVSISSGHNSSRAMKNISISDFPVLSNMDDEYLLDQHFLPFVLQLLCRVFRFNIHPLCLQAETTFRGLMKGQESANVSKMIVDKIDFLITCPVDSVFIRCASYRRLAGHVAEEYMELREKSMPVDISSDEGVPKISNAAAAHVGLASIRGSWASFLLQFVRAEEKLHRNNISSQGSQTVQSSEEQSSSRTSDCSSTRRIARELYWQLQVLREWRTLEDMLVNTNLFSDSWGKPQVQELLEEEMEAARSKPSTKNSNLSGERKGAADEFSSNEKVRSGIEVVSGVVPAGQPLSVYQGVWDSYRSLLECVGLVPQAFQQGSANVVRECVNSLAKSVETTYVSLDVCRTDMISAWSILTGSKRHPHLYPGGTVLAISRKPANAANDLSRKLKCLMKYVKKGRMAQAASEEDCLDSPYLGVSTGDLQFGSGHYGLLHICLTTAPTTTEDGDEENRYDYFDLPTWEKTITLIRSRQFDELASVTSSDKDGESIQRYNQNSEQRLSRKRSRKKSLKTVKKKRMDGLNSLCNQASSRSGLVHFSTYVQRCLAKGMLSTAATRIVLNNWSQVQGGESDSDTSSDTGDNEGEKDQPFNEANALPFGPSSSESEILKIEQFARTSAPDLFSIFVGITVLPKELAHWVSWLVPKPGSSGSEKKTSSKVQNKGKNGSKSPDAADYIFKTDPVVAYNKSIETWGYRLYGGNPPVDSRTRLLSAAAEILYHLGNVEARAEIEDNSRLRERLGKVAALEAAALSDDQEEPAAQHRSNPKFTEYFQDIGAPAQSQSSKSPELKLPVGEIGNTAIKSEGVKFSIVLCVSTVAGGVVKSMVGGDNDPADKQLEKLGNTAEKRKINIDKKLLFYRNQLALSSTSRMSLRQCLWTGLRFLHRPVDSSCLRDVYVSSLLKISCEGQEAGEKESDKLSISTVSSGYFFIRRWIWLQWPWFAALFAKIKSEEGRCASLKTSVASLSRDLEDATLQSFDEYCSKAPSLQDLENFKENLERSSPVRQAEAQSRETSSPGGKSNGLAASAEPGGPTEDEEPDNAFDQGYSTEEVLVKRVNELRSDYDSLKQGIEKMDSENARMESRVRQVDDSANMHAEEIMRDLTELKKLEKKVYRYNASVNAESAVAKWYEHLLKEMKAVPAHDEMYFSELAETINSARQKAKRMQEQVTKVAFDLERMKQDQYEEVVARLQKAQEENEKARKELQEQKKKIRREIKEHHAREMRKKQIEKEIKESEEQRAQKLAEQKIRTAEAEKRYADLGLPFHASHHDMSTKVDMLRWELDELKRNNADKLHAYEEWTTSLSRIAQLGGNISQMKQTGVRERAGSTVSNRLPSVVGARTRSSSLTRQSESLSTSLKRTSSEKNSRQWQDLFHSRQKFLDVVKADHQDATRKLTEAEKLREMSSSGANQPAAAYDLCTLSINGLATKLRSKSPQRSKGQADQTTMDERDSAVEEETREAQQLQRAWKHVRQIRQEASTSSSELQRLRRRVSYMFNSLYQIEIGASHLTSLANASAMTSKKPQTEEVSGIPSYSYDALSRVQDALTRRTTEIIEYASRSDAFAGNQVMNDNVAVERLERLIEYKESTVLRNVCHHIQSVMYTTGSVTPEKIGHIEIDEGVPKLDVTEAHTSSFKVMVSVVVLVWRGLPRAATFLRNVAYVVNTLTEHDVCLTVLASLPTRIWTKLLQSLQSDVAQRDQHQTKHKAIADVVEMAIRIISSPNQTEPPASNSYKRDKEERASEEGSERNSPAPAPYAQHGQVGSFSRKSGPLMLDLDTNEEGYIDPQKLGEASSTSGIKVNDSSRAYQRRASLSSTGKLPGVSEEPSEGERSSKLIKQQLTKMRRGSGVDGLEGLAPLKVLSQEKDSQISPAPPESPSASSSVDNIFSKFFGDEGYSDEGEDASEQDSAGKTTDFSGMYGKLSNPVGKAVTMIQKQYNKDGEGDMNLKYQTTSYMQRSNYLSRRRMKGQSEKLKKAYGHTEESTEESNENPQAQEPSKTEGKDTKSSAPKDYQKPAPEKRQPKKSGSFIEFHKVPTDELLKMQQRRHADFAAKREMRRARAKQHASIKSSMKRKNIAAEAVQAVADDVQLWDESFIAAGNSRLSEAMASYSEQTPEELRKDPGSAGGPTRRTSMADVYAMGNEPDDEDHDDDALFHPTSSRRGSISGKRRGSALSTSKSSAVLQSSKGHSKQDSNRKGSMRESDSLPALNRS